MNGPLIEEEENRRMAKMKKRLMCPSILRKAISIFYRSKDQRKLIIYHN